MKRLFLAILVILTLATLATVWSLPAVRSSVPVLHWVTDPNPARHRQIEGFHRWLVEQGHVTPQGTPILELRLDTANRDIAKQIIQGVSGVAGDILDLNSGVAMRQLQAIGLLTDLTDDAGPMGFDLSRTYPAMASELTIDGRQYMFPCNVASVLYWVNLDTFDRYGQPPPTWGRTWTIDEFEEAGRRFVQAANAPEAGQPLRVFFSNDGDIPQWVRGQGLDRYNETLTACTLDDPRYVHVLEKMHQWTFVDRLIPSSADMASSPTDAGYGGAALQLFGSGRIAMLRSGRYALIQWRQFNARRAERGEKPMRLAVVEPPHTGYRNTLINTRAAAIYVGSRHPDLAKLFLSYLADASYNQQIILDADALPPNPAYTQTPAFHHPPGRPEEAGVHAPFALAAQTTAIPSSHSPFLSSAVADRLEKEAYEMFMNGRLSASDAARLTAAHINEQIRRELRRDETLRPEYERLVKIQQRIDQRRQAGRRIPRQWVSNPFHLKYYQDMGWLE